MIPLLPLASLTKPQIFTAWWIFGGVLTVLILDTWLTVNGYESDTITDVIRKVSHDHPIIPFAFGVVAGHLWWHS